MEENEDLSSKKVGAENHPRENQGGNQYLFLFWSHLKGPTENPRIQRNVLKGIFDFISILQCYESLIQTRY